MQELVELCGTIDKEIYKNGENGFSIFTLKVTAKEDITVQGYLPQIHQGENVTLKGKWVFHKKFGRQFEASECKAQLPSTTTGIKKYLASGLIRGIGPKFAEKLVEAFGEKTLEIIDTNPVKLLTIYGVGPKKVESITNAWHDQKEISKVMVFLKEKDISTAFAVKIYKTYGDESLKLIQDDPYKLVEDIWGIGFKSADQLALKLGLEKDSIKRIKSGILYCITENINNGHLYIEVEECKEKSLKLLELENNNNNKLLLKKSLNELYSQDKIKLISQTEDKHFISLPKYYFSEKGISNKILKLQEKKSNNLNFDLSNIYKLSCVKDSRNIELNELQQHGIMAAFQSKITIITGGPGTGKTTLLRKLLDILDFYKIKFKLAAPTGRASKRMFEGTGRNAETLHRLLEFKPEIMNFARNEYNALELDFLIIDEASMIDVFLMHSTLRALPDNAHLILLGDIDQLPSVGAGNVLNDLIASEKITTIKLTEIFRQAQNSLIIVNAHRVNKGEFPTTSIPESKNDFIYIKENNAENIFPLLHKIYRSTLQKHFINPENSIVLTPMNKGIAGTQRINQELQLILNPANSNLAEVARFGQIYREGDRVMQIKNNYDKFVFNGDIGQIKKIDNENQILFINFGERDLEYDFTELNEIVLSYAVSIHKSQGSEFDAVIIPVFMQHFILLQRNLIYTAITRAKKLCILIGEPRAIAMAIKNNKSIKRNTFLKEFLTTNLEARQ
ncbi:ATP-dependent RecD-like DNA helicase [Candidatus Dependentiae bacterium]|nr:ATP-dependent RecD-like DNA helicase [Candidatus Dependentiae bacterium]MBU4387687.1 ATP-dependent RecD-like DNA helicase [Candidatus Dependentiae bacterium]